MAGSVARHAGDLHDLRAGGSCAIASLGGAWTRTLKCGLSSHPRFATSQERVMRWVASMLMAVVVTFGIFVVLSRSTTNLELREAPAECRAVRAGSPRPPQREAICARRPRETEVPVKADHEPPVSSIGMSSLLVEAPTLGIPFDRERSLAPTIRHKTGADSGEEPADEGDLGGPD